jgi:hypothetical protein
VKTDVIKLLLLSSLIPGASTFAQARTSANYSITAETADAGGGTASAAAYTMNGSVGAVVGMSSSGSPAETAQAGYIGELYEVTALEITATATTVNVKQTLQLGATGSLDDGTILVFDPGTIAWSAQSGPITGISTSGLATAGVVYADSPAVVSGGVDGFSASLGLPVVNSGFDAWQVEYFGANNPLAAAGADADGTGETNEFKYIAGLNPIDPTSRFTVTTTPASQPGEMTITFSPVVTGRSYTVRYSTDLTSDWQPLPGASESTSGNSMVVVDPNARVPAKFYQILISY